MQGRRLYDLSRSEIRRTLLYLDVEGSLCSALERALSSGEYKPMKGALLRRPMTRERSRKYIVTLYIRIVIVTIIITAITRIQMLPA